MAGDQLKPEQSATVKKHPFQGRTIAIVNDLSLDEQWYVYHKTRELKEAIRTGENLDQFRLQNREAAVYTIFMEDSTRTKESFRNAAEFHGLKVNVFDAKTSSFQKNETITDTIKMLCGYSTGQSLFVIRSKEMLDEFSFLETKGAAADASPVHPKPRAATRLGYLEHPLGLVG
eukprot:Skav226290  [mRNA]  locus=scaffold3301:190912:193577:+ [translate_table: standard]